MAQGGNRQKRKRRQRERGGPKATAAPEAPATADGEPAAPRPARAERARAKDDAARAALEPLEPGERPTAVTIGFVVAVIGCISNIVGLIIGFEPSDGSDQTPVLVFGIAIMAVVAFGMWRARYWAVLGFQTILAFTIIIAAIALTGATSILAAIVIVLILAGSIALFWGLVKSMARIQMPERPGAQRSE